MEFPTALLGVALGTILLPSLSNAHASNDLQEYSSLLDWGLRLTFLLALPCAVGLATLSEPLTATLFHYGKFDALAVTMTSHALIAYGVGLIGLILVKILAPGFYAKQDIKTPVKIAVGVLITTQLMNYVFVPWIAHAGLALSIGLGACLNAGFLFWGLRHRNIYVPQPGWRMFLIKLTGALFLLAGVACLSPAISTGSPCAPIRQHASVPCCWCWPPAPWLTSDHWQRWDSASAISNAYHADLVNLHRSNFASQQSQAKHFTRALILIAWVSYDAHIS